MTSSQLIPRFRSSLILQSPWRHQKITQLCRTKILQAKHISAGMLHSPMARMRSSTRLSVSSTMFSATRRAALSRKHFLKKASAEMSARSMNRAWHSLYGLSSPNMQTLIRTLNLRKQLTRRLRISSEMVLTQMPLQPV